MIPKVKHPSEFIDAEAVNVIRETAASAEQSGDLHARQSELIHKHGWFKMFIPEAYGGLGWSLPRVLRMEEALSWADGSTGWVVTLCSGAGWFAGFLDSQIVHEFLSNSEMCFAGSGAPTGTANLNSGSYEVHGRWQYASGSLHATAFTANCLVYEDNVQQFQADGSPLVRAFIFHREEVILHHEWKGMGMIATGSHSFEIKGLRVPASRSFAIEPSAARLPDPVYQYPFLQLAEATLSVNLSGMAMRFLDLCEQLFTQRMERPQTRRRGPDLFRLLADARAGMDGHRHEFYRAVDISWETCMQHQVISSPLLDAVSHASYALAGRSIQVVDKLYLYCGLAAASRDTEINRVWRNLHTASQHTMFSEGLKDGIPA